MRRLFFAAALALCAGCSCGEQVPPDGAVDGRVQGDAYDVIVVGATTGGIAAALQASRMGARVLLLEETDYIGGQASAGGVSTMDEYTHVLDHLGGIYAELIARAVAFYGDRPTDTCYFGDAVGTQNRYCFEPFVVRDIFEAMIAEERAAGRVLDLVERATVTAVARTGDTVTGVTVRLEPDGTIEEHGAGVVIDATEYGDVLPLAGARYRIANRTSEDLDPLAHIQNFSYVAVIRRYPGGIPSELRVPGPLPGYEEDAISFRPNIPYAEGYSGIQYGRPWTFAHHNAYRGMPDSTSPAFYRAGSEADNAQITKTALNMINEYPGGVGPAPFQTGLLRAAHIIDPVERHRIDCEGRRRTLNFLYYFQTELGVDDWTVAVEEGYATPANDANVCDESIIPAAARPIDRHLAPIPYARESRRLRATFTVTGAETMRNGPPIFAGAMPTARVRFATSSGIGTIPPDLLHGCDSNRCLELDLESVDDAGFGFGPYQIPLESLIPESVDGLLAGELNVGDSRAVMGGHRTQQSTMATGQAAGALAAIAVRDGAAPRDVHPILVQQALLASNSTLSIWRFDDVPPEHPRWADVQLVSMREVMRGTDFVFGVDTPLDRAFLARVLTNLFSLPLAPCANRFADAAGNPLCDSIEAVVDAGLVEPCAAGAFCPGDGVDRGTIGIALARGLALDLATPRQVTLDDVALDHPAHAAVEALAAEGIAIGCNTTAFCPDLVASRGEAATMVAGVLARVPTEPLAEPESRWTRTRTLAAHWTRAWSTEPIAEYRYAVGRSPGATDVLDWTSAGTARSASVPLPGAGTFYLSVRARSADGVWSPTWTARSVRTDEDRPYGVDASARLVAGGARLLAHAFDGSGISAVSFAVDGAAPIRGGVSYSWPDSGYELEWRGSGEHELVVAALDAAGNTSSCTATIRTDVLVTSPAACSAVAGQTVVLRADAAADTTDVVFSVDGAELGTDPEPPYAIVWTPSSPGAHVVEARRLSPGGAAAHSVRATVDLTPPSVTLTSPGASASAGLLQIAADASGDVRNVRFYLAAETPAWQPAALAGAPDASYRMAASGDMDGDTYGDLIWQSGASLLVSSGRTGEAMTLDAAGCTVAAGSVLSAAADFDRDARVDLLWLQPGDGTNGAVTLWRMGRMRCLESRVLRRQVPDPGWQIAAVGDLGGDGEIDAVFRNAALDATVVWVMERGEHVTSVPIAEPVPAPWTVAGIMDVDLDGQRDILLYEPSQRAVVAWLMSGVARRSSLTLVQAGQASADLAFLGIAELDADGSHGELLWRRVSSPTSMEWWRGGFPALLATDFDPPYEASRTLGAGRFWITARATDLAGNIAEDSRLVDVR